MNRLLLSLMLIGTLPALGCGEPGGAQIVESFGHRASNGGDSAAHETLAQKARRACEEASAALAGCGSQVSACGKIEALSSQCQSELSEYYLCLAENLSCRGSLGNDDLEALGACLSQHPVSRSCQ